MNNPSVSQPTAWRVRCYDAKDNLHSDVTRYEPVPDFERANLEHHFRVDITELVDLQAANALAADLLDIVRAVAAMADKLDSMSAAERAAFPSALSSFSPLVIAARQACVDRGLTDGGLMIDAGQAARTANFIAAQAEMAGQA